MTRWFHQNIQAWIDHYQIDKLDVVIEMPILRTSKFGTGDAVTTLMNQMRQISAYEQSLMHLEHCTVRLGVVSNNTAKAIFTNVGNASKDMMITFSVWNRRPDVDDREHLADAQGIGTCHPQMFVMDQLLPPSATRYEDQHIGEGPLWKGK